MIDMLISNGSNQKWMNKVDLTSLPKDTSISAFKLLRMEPLPIVNGHLMLKLQVLLATLVSKWMGEWANQHGIFANHVYVCMCDKR